MGALGPFRRRLTALALAAAMSTATIPGADAQTAGDAAFPPAFPPYPTATRFVDLKLWIAGNTNLTYTQIILTSADSVFAFTDDGPLAQLD